jgi:hypothetical protein
VDGLMVGRVEETIGVAGFLGHLQAAVKHGSPGTAGERIAFHGGHGSFTVFTLTPKAVIIFPDTLAVTTRKFHST